MSTFSHSSAFESDVKVKISHLRRENEFALSNVQNNENALKLIILMILFVIILFVLVIVVTVYEVPDEHLSSLSTIENEANRIDRIQYPNSEYDNFCSFIDDIDANNLVEAMLQNSPFEDYRISSLGGEDYKCTGSCYCEVDERRRSSSVVTRSLYLIVTAVSSTLAYKMAKETFQKECDDSHIKEEFECTSIHSEINDCTPKDSKKEEEENKNILKDKCKISEEKLKEIVEEKTKKALKELENQCEDDQETAGVDKNSKLYPIERIEKLIQNTKVKLTEDLRKEINKICQDQGLLGPLVGHGAMLIGNVVIAISASSATIFSVYLNYRLVKKINNEKFFETGKSLKMFSQGLCSINDQMKISVFCEDIVTMRPTWASSEKLEGQKDIIEYFNRMNYYDYVHSSLFHICEEILLVENQNLENMVFFLNKTGEERIEYFEEFELTISIDILNAGEREIGEIKSCWKGEKSEFVKFTGRQIPLPEKEQKNKWKFL